MKRETQRRARVAVVVPLPDAPVSDKEAQMAIDDALRSGDYELVDWMERRDAQMPAMSPRDKRKSVTLFVRPKDTVVIVSDDQDVQHVHGQVAGVHIGVLPQKQAERVENLLMRTAGGGASVAGRAAIRAYYKIVPPRLPLPAIKIDGGGR